MSGRAEPTVPHPCRVGGSYAWLKFGGHHGPGAWHLATQRSKLKPVREVSRARVTTLPPMRYVRIPHPRLATPLPLLSRDAGAPSASAACGRCTPLTVAARGRGLAGANRRADHRALVGSWRIGGDDRDHGCARARHAVARAAWPLDVSAAWTRPPQPAAPPRPPAPARPN